MSKSVRILALVLSLGMITANCGGGGYSAEVRSTLMDQCGGAWDDPFCGCALDYFESQGNETWFKALGTDFSDSGSWLIGVPGFALIECQDRFQG